MSVDSGKIQEQLRTTVIEGIDKLPSLSPAVQDIITLSSDLSATPKDLLDIIKTDPVLTAKIIKLVNSAYFSLSNKVVSLNRALVLLGFNTIKNIAISTEFVNLSSKAPENKFFKYRELWEHMLAVGAVSKYMAREGGEDRKKLEEYFIAGLIHDLGDFLMMRFIPDEFNRVRNYALEKDLAVRECAAKVIGFSSGEMGGELARQWKLQEHLQKLILNVDCFTETSARLDRTVALADQFCRFHDIGYVNDESRLKGFPSPADLAEVGLPDAFFEEHREALFEAIDKAKVFIS